MRIAAITRGWAGIVAGVMIMAGCAGKIEYTKYTAKDPELRLSVDVVQGWDAREYRGSHDSFAEVVFLEPARKDKPRRALLAIQAQPAAGRSARQFLDALIAKSRAMPGWKLGATGKRTVAGAPAVTAELSYLGPTTPNTISLNLKPMRENVAVLVQGNTLYLVRYENMAVAFDRFAPAFQRALDSLVFASSQ